MLTDNDPMPYGLHEGTPMKDVPADYLLFLNDEGKTSPEVQDYIDRNWDALNDEN